MKNCTRARVWHKYDGWWKWCVLWISHNAPAEWFNKVPFSSFSIVFQTHLNIAVAERKWREEKRNKSLNADSRVKMYIYVQKHNSISLKNRGSFFHNWDLITLQLKIFPLLIFWTTFSWIYYWSFDEDLFIGVSFSISVPEKFSIFS